MHDYIKEVLRAEYDDIYQFSYDYFDHKCKGEEFLFKNKFINEDEEGILPSDK